jgi:hypothetical protein
MDELKSCNTSSYIGAKMHSDTVTKWVYLNNLDEKQIKSDTEYKVWLDVTDEKANPEQTQPYTCKVFWFEEVPQEIIEAEELVKRYWATKEPKK